MKNEIKKNIEVGSYRLPKWILDDYGIVDEVKDGIVVVKEGLNKVGMSEMVIFEKTSMKGIVNSLGKEKTITVLGNIRNSKVGDMVKRLRTLPLVKFCKFQYFCKPLVFKRNYCIKKNDNGFLSKIKNVFKKNIDVINLYFEQLRYVNMIVQSLIFITGFLLIFYAINYHNILLFIFIVITLIYILFLRYLKIKIIKIKDTKVNGFFYKNLTFFILNLTIYFGLIVYVNVDNNNKNYILYDYLMINKWNSIPYLFIVITLLLIIGVFIILLNYKQLEKTEESILASEARQLKLKKYQDVIDISLENNFFIKNYGSIIRSYNKFFNNNLIIYSIFTFIMLTFDFNSINFIIIIWQCYIIFYYITIIPILFIIILNIYLFVSHIKYCIIWNSDRYGTVNNLNHVYKKIKHFTNLGVWRIVGLICVGYMSYNIWHKFSYPDMPTPIERINENYIKPFMKSTFDVPSDELLKKYKKSDIKSDDLLGEDKKKD